MVLIGLTIARDVIVDDPWGDWNPGYRGTPNNGNARVHAFEEMNAIVRDGGKNRKWAHPMRDPV